MKPRFGPIPFRAFADKRLTAVDLRVLGAIAAHDCFEFRGLGCTAAHLRIARIVAAAEKSVSRSIAKLGRVGYLKSKPSPVDRRKRAYIVIYGPGDHEAFRAGGDSKSAMRADARQEQEIDRNAVTVADTESVTDLAQSVTGDVKVGNRDRDARACFERDLARPIETSEYKPGKIAATQTDAHPKASRESQRAKPLLDASGISNLEPFDEMQEALSVIGDAWSRFRSKPIVLSGAEKAALKVSIRNNGVQRLLQCIECARASPFLRGERGDWNGMPFKWLLNEGRLIEIERGDYGEGQHRRTTRSGPGVLDDLRDLLDRS